MAKAGDNQYTAEVVPGGNDLGLRRKDLTETRKVARAGTYWLSANKPSWREVGTYPVRERGGVSVDGKMGGPPRSGKLPEPYPLISLGFFRLARRSVAGCGQCPQPYPLISLGFLAAVSRAFPFRAMPTTGEKAALMPLG